MRIVYSAWDTNAYNHVCMYACSGLCMPWVGTGQALCTLHVHYKLVLGRHITVLFDVK